MALTYKKCPNCGSKNIINIIYGLPTYELFKEEEQGKVKLGGCVIGLDDPEYTCKDCNHEWNRRHIIDDAYGKIVRLKITVDRFGGPSYEVDLDFKNMQLIWNSREEEPQGVFTKNFNERDYKDLIEQLKLINLLNWKAKYIEPDVCDGTQWGVEIFTDKRTIRKYGDNKFPENWVWFCNQVAEITGKKFN